MPQCLEQYEENNKLSLFWLLGCITPRQHGIDRDVVRFRLFLLQKEFAHDFDT